MPSELKGLSSADRVPLPAASSTAGAGPVSPSHALTRTAPIDPREPATTPTHPLGRSGLDLLDVLATTDVVTHRDRTGTVALEVGLEQARGSLLRNLPSDALTALDAVWEGARKTEEGWYLRSGSLTVLGLPGESERVALEGLGLRPTSLALRFMQSLSRMSLGDLAGARAVLQPALQRAPGNPLLQVQHALLLAKQGDARSAEGLLARVEVEPEHPAMVWGRSALRGIVADATRQRSRPTPIDWPAAMPGVVPTAARATPMASDVIFADITGDADVARTPEPARARDGEAIRSEVASTEGATTDVAAAALERFGARVSMRPMAELAREARMLMRAFSAGGTLASATNAEQAHAARVVLTTFVGVASGEGAEVPAPIRDLVEQLVPLLQQGRFDEAERVLRRHSTLVREPIARLLSAIVRGGVVAEGQRTALLRDTESTVSAVRDTPSPSFSILTERMSGTPAAGMPMVRGDMERAPVIPVRLGLSLLEETSASRAALETGMLVSTTQSGSVTAIRNAEVEGEGWGAAHAVLQRSRESEWSDGAGVRAAALVCVALAAAALVTGHGAMAIGLAVGAVWLGLRRSGREGERSRSHDRTPTQ
ncbi:MAG: hypothetical protein ABMA00_11430 [Gemmatimonas sp.]